MSERQKRRIIIMYEYNENFKNESRQNIELH